MQTAYKSTTNAALEQDIHVTHNIDDKYQTDVIILDFSKTFDTVPHHILLQKLERYGLDHSCHNWIAEWLNQRTQVVVLNGEYYQEQ